MLNRFSATQKSLENNFLILKWVGFKRVFVVLTCVDEQTRQGTDQFQGQDGQNEVEIQPAGLWEGMLYAQCEEESCAAWRRK